MRSLRISFDLAVVLVFVSIGRAHHNDGESAKGIFTTTWPFAIGLLLAWLFLIKTKRGGWTFKAGVLVASVTTAVGMILRVIAGQGTAASFIIVAFAFLLFGMLGWRLIAKVITKRSAN
jgi:hypothetical protein